MIGKRFYDDSNKDHWEIVEYIVQNKWRCHSLTIDGKVCVYDYQDLLRLLSLSMF